MMDHGREEETGSRDSSSMSDEQRSKRRKLRSRSSSSDLTHDTEDHDESSSQCHSRRSIEYRSQRRRDEPRSRSRSRSQIRCHKRSDSDREDNRQRKSSNAEHSSGSNSESCESKRSRRDFITIQPAPRELDNETLGKKHQHNNKLVEDAIANKQYELCDISDTDSDIDNLLKIDIASRNRNVEYIITVMKSTDMLYAATAIKKSTWLITEQQYANIINPEYLHTQLLPSMNTKTFNKLMLHIRLNLKDESRVETFYEYLKETKSSYKWLQNCSIAFIENVIKNERLVPLYLFKRLCKRSAHFLAYYTRVELSSKKVVKKEILFLLKSHTEDVLNIVEDEACDYFPKIGKKKTKILMKTCPKRVLDNLDKYADTIDLSVLAKYLNENEIKAFLYKQAKNLGARLYDHDTLRHFIKNMPKEERFEFVRKTFIDKDEMSLLFSEEERRIIESNINPYQWYEFEPDFYSALHEIRKLIRKEKSPAKRCAMLTVLITSARRNPGHIKILLKFFKDKHINEPFKFKIQFVNNLLSQISTHEFDVETWNLLNQLFHSMEVYTESDNNVQLCLGSIILYKVLRNEPIPEIVEQKMTLNPFKKLRKRLNQDQKRKIFTYLLNFVLRNVQRENIANESDFGETVLQLKNALTFIRYWKKDISKYPNVLETIQKLIKIRQENMWKTDMSCLYNVKKSWRKHMFEESLSLCLCEEACLNALKHKPQLLTRHDKEIDTLRTNDAVSLRRLLAKLRVYWPHSLAQHWINAYLLNLKNPTGQKGIIKGLFMLLPQKQIIDMAKEYAPYYLKINWRQNDRAEMSIRKNIAKYLHLARPLIPLDTVLWYARGDYLQHAVPSLNAILYNMNEIDSHEHLPKLLEAPVSLQKFGLHLVYFKLKSDDLKSTYSKVWNRTQNVSIKVIIFKHTYDRMCNVKDPSVINELWELLSTFMDEIFSGRLGHVEHVPISVRAKYYMKSYVFINGLPRSANFESYVDDLIQYAPQIMDTLDSNFVADKMLSPADLKFCSYESKFIDNFACYVLCGKSQEDQLQRFSRVVDLALDKAFQLWRSYDVRNNYINFLESLVWYFRTYVTLNKIPMPAKLFAQIKIKSENQLPLIDNYVLFTGFKLIAEYVKLMDTEGCASIALEFCKFTESEIRDGRKADAIENVWKHIHSRISPLLGPVIVKCLEEDIEQYSPTIHSLFAEALEKMFQLFAFKNYDMFVLETLKYMLDDNDFIPSYLVVSKVIPKHCNDNELKCRQLEIRETLRSHPSTTVQVHYRNDFRNVLED